MKTLLLVISMAIFASAESAIEEPPGINRFSPTEIPKSESSNDHNLNFQESEEVVRYIVFPGLDAAADEIAEWVTGFASPFNVYFGPKPYIVGWIGEGGGFDPDDPDIGEPDYGDDDSNEDDDDEYDPDFDPEDFYPERKSG